MEKLQIVLLVTLLLVGNVGAEKWQMNQKDIWHTGRADFQVPQTKLNDTFFDDIAWQKVSAGQSEGSGMIFYDGVGPGGVDIVCLGQSVEQRCITAVDRHTGAFLWQGGPTGGTNIGKDTGAFSNDGTVFYMTSDISAAHLYAWNTAAGPGTVVTPLWWDSSSDPNEDAISMRCPVVAPDGRIFLHRWNNKVSAAQDNGTSLTLSWLASYDALNCMSDVSLYEDEGDLTVITSGRRRRVVAFAGDTGAELWQYDSGQITDATVTIDPDNGNIYLHAGMDGDTYVIGLDKDGGQLAGWSDKKIKVRDWVDGLLYLPTRMIWTTSNGDGDPPTNAVANCMTAFNLAGCDLIEVDLNNDCKIDLLDFVKLSAHWLDLGRDVSMSVSDGGESVVPCSPNRKRPRCLQTIRYLR